MRSTTQPVWHHLWLRRKLSEDDNPNYVILVYTRPLDTDTPSAYTRQDNSMSWISLVHFVSLSDQFSHFVVVLLLILNKCYFLLMCAFGVSILKLCCTVVVLRLHSDFVSPIGSNESLWAFCGFLQLFCFSCWFFMSVLVTLCLFVVVFQIWSNFVSLYIVLHLLLVVMCLFVVVF